MTKTRKKVARRKGKGLPFPVIDLFAGPGGLGEGFAALGDERDNPIFQNVLSIEQDELSHKTLLLRHFFRSFRPDELPEDYYDFVARRISRDELYARHKDSYHAASESAVRLSLGPNSHEPVRRLINSRLSRRNAWVLVGGPPCQAYSLVGRSRMRGDPEFEKDERHFLYREYLKIICDHAPPVFVMENVKGLLSATISGRSVISEIIADLSQPKKAFGKQSGGPEYRLYSFTENTQNVELTDPRSFVVKAEEYGIPQARHRIFILGIRSDLNITPSTLQRRKSPTVRQTIGNLPAIRSGISRKADSPELWRSELTSQDLGELRQRLNGADYAADLISEIKFALKRSNAYPTETFSRRYPGHFRSNHAALLGIYDERLPVLIEHEARSHMPSDLRRYLFAASFAKVNECSPKLVDFPRHLLPKHKNVSLGRSGKMFSDRFRVQLPDTQSTTITSHISKDGHYFIHYDPLQCRSLTVREAARLQTFPDNYFFEGPRTSQYHQVGNAVPPYLAGQIAEVVAQVLRSIRGAGDD
ncbi:MAG: DNA (cytosine-5-)-methyltransferase [Parvularcula sp.]|nr:DNA (cytosine-5-)-methyltransferase [Parvularcula sp.]